jgi:uncharacterized repeat protein (TIGR03943 family)
LRENLRTRWLGLLLSLIGVIAVLALATTGGLELYIHPRYTVFTVVMGVIGGVATVAALLFAPGADHDHHHDHDHEEPEGPRSPTRRTRRALGTLGGVLIVLAAIVGLLVVPPTTLTASTAQNRDLTGLPAALDSVETAELVGGDPTTFTIKDWSALLRQGLSDDFFAGKPASIIGFVVPTADPDVFYLARFLVTCCAVDAQPLAVPVLLSGWEHQVSADDWLEIDGRFAVGADPTGPEPIVLVPDSVTAVERPAEPYVY